MSAYLHVVIQRLYLDHQIGKWGKWHSSAEARRRGEIAVELERLIYRDGHTIQEAVEQLEGMSHIYASREDLLRLAYALPVRYRTRFVSDDQVSGTMVAVDPIERRESEVWARRLQTELAQAMSELDGEDRRLLKMRFSERRTVPEIAANLDVDAKPLYARIRRLLERIRHRLESGASEVGKRRFISQRRRGRSTWMKSSRTLFDTGYACCSRVWAMARDCSWTSSFMADSIT